MAQLGLGTRCVQAGYSPKNGEPRQIPIIQSTTFKYESSAEMGRLFDLEASGYFYSRLQNPTNDAVAARIAALEGGTAAMLTASGQAAIFFAVFNIVGAGDHLVSSSSIYGGSFNLFAVTMKRMGVEVTFVAPDCSAEELDAVQAKIAQSEQTGRSIGLGNISRRIGMLYPGGKMQVYSRAGHGTVVRFELPQTQQPEEKEETLS